MKKLTMLCCPVLMVALLLVSNVLAECGHSSPTPCPICASSAAQPQPKSKTKRATQNAGVPSAGFLFLDVLELVLAKSTGLGLERLF